MSAKTVRRLTRAIDALCALNADPDLRMPMSAGVRESIGDPVHKLIDKLKRIRAEHAPQKPEVKK